MVKRSLFLAFAWLALAGPARAGDATIAARDLPVGRTRAPAAAQPPTRFDLIGFHWQGPGDVVFRTQSVSGRWSGWTAADTDDNRAGRWHLGNPVWTGASDRVEYRIVGSVLRLRAYYVWSPVEAIPLRRVSIAGSPGIIPRLGWQADESVKRGPPVYAPVLRFAVIHHTAGTNDYQPDQSAAIVRGIELYHVKGNGWKDIGYNFLVDKFGQVFEGRFGGIDRNVVGAHAEGFNRGSVGVSVLGNYGSHGISAAAERSLVKLLAWRLDVAHADPLSTLTWASGGNPRFPAGVPVFLRAISGHRDTGFTDCPGNAFYRQLPRITSEVAATGLPKLYAPSVQGKLGGPVVFQARLSSALHWTVTVTDQSRKVVASGSGTGTTVSWTWSSAGAAVGRYAWTINAGPAVRPAGGTIGTTLPPPGLPVLAGLSVMPPFISPNGDGVADAATISYTLGERASVTATVADESGAIVATLFADQRQSPRLISFTWAADGIADGRYTLKVSARGDDGRTASAQAAVLVDRTLASLAVSPAAFTPGNGATMAITFTLATAARVSVQIAQNGQPVAAVFSGQLDAGPQQVTWDGTTPSGPASPGHYDVLVTVTDQLGDISESTGFDVSSAPPPS
jgi:flagellar hook assembly protein FlgD